MDPLGVYRVWKDGAQGDLESLPFTLFFMALSVGGYLLWARPVIVIEGDSVYIRNPFQQATASVSDLDTLTSWYGVFPTIRVNGRRIWLLALEASTLDSMSGGSRGWKAIEGHRRSSEPVHGQEGQRRQRRRHDWGTLGVIALWVAYWGAWLLVGGPGRIH